MIIAQAVAVGIGFLLNLLFGAPDFMLRLIGGINSTIKKAVKKIFPKSNGGGAFTVFLLVIISGGIPFLILFFAYRYHIVLGTLLEIILCYFVFSTKSSVRKSMKVYSFLIHEDIGNARRAAAFFTGRKADECDDTEITRRTVEGICENICEGAVSPIFYMILGGAAAGYIYKAVNISASFFKGNGNNAGRFILGLERALNFIPERIAAYIMIISSYIFKFDGKYAAIIHRRDSRKKVYCAHIKSAAAGALRIRICNVPVIGDAVGDVQYSNISQSNRIMYMTALIMLFLCVGIKITIGLILHGFQ